MSDGSEGFSELLRTKTFCTMGRILLLGSSALLSAGTTNKDCERAAMSLLTG